MSDKIDKLIVIEGSDGSGKTTQANLLKERFDKIMGQDYSTILDFPDYKSKTGELITHMLTGGYGNDTKNLNPYFTSPMYSLDRFQYLQRINSGYDHINVGICNRYTDSNLIHQGARIDNLNELIQYWNWLYDFEFNKLKLRKPDITIFLYVPAHVSLANIEHRASQDKDRIIDINETKEYLYLVERHIHRIKSLTNWHMINCFDMDRGEMRSAQDIHDEIIRYLRNDSKDSLMKWLLFNEV